MGINTSNKFFTCIKVEDKLLTDAATQLVIDNNFKLPDFIKNSVLVAGEVMLNSYF